MKIVQLLILLAIGLSVHSCGNEAPPVNEPTPVDQQETPATQPATPEDNDTGFKADYKDQDRLVWQRPEMIMNLLGNGDMSEKVVADVGAGTGFFALRLAQRVNKVIALDIDPHFIDYLDSVKVMQLSEDMQPKLEARLTPRDHAELLDEEIDAALIVNTFMYIEDKVNYLRKLKNGLAEGGRVVIVDFKRKRTPFGPPAELRLPLYMAENQLSEAGYTNIRTDDRSLDYQYIVIAEK